MKVASARVGKRVDSGRLWAIDRGDVLNQSGAGLLARRATTGRVSEVQQGGEGTHRLDVD